MPGDALLPAPWEVDAALRRIGLDAPQRRAEDMARGWTRACLLWDLAELKAIRQALQDAWEALPDARHRQCGNGRVLSAFLDATRPLAASPDPRQHASAFLALPWPQPRKGA